MKRIENVKIVHSPMFQQTMRSLRPRLTFTSAGITLIVIFFISLTLGIVYTTYTNSVIEITRRYDDICQLNTFCNVDIEIPETMVGDITLKYKLTKFYQNHRRYSVSISYSQLEGKYVEFEDMSSCEPIISINNSQDPNQWILPCGLVARTFFNDTFTPIIPGTDFRENLIVTDLEVNELFQPLNAKYTSGYFWLEGYTDFPGGQNNPHFAVWTRSGHLPTLIKDYAKCEKCRIEKGTYNITVKTNYPNDLFKGTKSIILTTDSLLGTKNSFLSIIFLVFGGISLLMGIFFLIWSWKHPNDDANAMRIEQTINNMERAKTEATLKVMKTLRGE